MNKVVLIGWSIMLAAFVYATKELKAANSDFSIQVARCEQSRITSSNNRVVLPASR